MKIMTNKSIIELKSNSFNQGFKNGTQYIVDFLSKMKSINVYNKSVTMNTKKSAVIKDSLFACKSNGVSVRTEGK